MTSTSEMRRSGISVVGDRPWGTHFCNFYESGSDLFHMLLSYFKAGLEDNEFCVWVVSDPLSERDAWDGLREAVPDFDQYLSKRSIEVFDGHDWYLKGGTFDSSRVMTAWNEKLDRALDQGYAGLRGTGNTAWLQKKDWKAFSEYEQLVNDSVAGRRTILLCTYALNSCGANELLDVVATHQFATARRRGDWELIETPELKQAKAEIKKMNDDLESRVLQRTAELEAASHQLSQAQAELAHINRVTTMGELAASIAHEIKQPISAASINAATCLEWLQRDVPDLVEASEAATRVVQAVRRAGDVISKISSFFKKGILQRELLDVNELIREMTVMLRSEAMRYSISVRTELAENLPQVLADRVQLQQVFMNLMLNGFDAMKESSRGSELTIKSEVCNHQVLISVRDTGLGLPSGQAEQVFDPFFTTKETGTGMGLPISRSIIESHGGRLWATGNSGSGATFQFSLPTAAAAGGVAAA
jgi:C4-dicarboxylate-specific signal transduction histidine kinase